MEAFYEQRKTDIEKIDDRLATVIELVERARPGRVLDLACGRGTLLAALRARLPAVELVGADISPDSVERTRARGFEAVVADATAPLPFAGDNFDCVVFGEVIEHVVDPDAALVAIGRVLRVGGHLIVTTPNLASWFNRILLLLGVQPIFTETSLHVNLGRRIAALGQWRETQGHLKIFTLAALREMLAANGFHVETVRGACFHAQTPLMPLDRVISRVPTLASNFVVSARNLGTRATAYPARRS